MTDLRPHLVRFMLRYKTYLQLHVRTTYFGPKPAPKSYLGPYLSKKNLACFMLRFPGSLTCTV